VLSSRHAVIIVRPPNKLTDNPTFTARSNFNWSARTAGFFPSLPAVHFLALGVWMSLDKLSDESVLRLYDSIRNEVVRDNRVPQPLMRETAKQRAEQLREELERRRLRFTLIDWPPK